MRISLSLSWGCPIREVAQLHAGGIALVIIIIAIVIIIITAIVIVIITAIVIIIDIGHSCIFQGHWEELGLKSGRAGGEQ